MEDFVRDEDLIELSEDQRKKQKYLFPENKHDEAILVCLQGVDWLVCALRWTDNLEPVV